MKTLSLAILLLGVACAPAATTSSARVTAADMPSEPAPTEAPAPREASATVQTKAQAESPGGRLVCRANSPADGTIELYVEADSGTLRRTTPSGNLETTKVRIENVRDMVIADEPGSTDLAVHAATVRAHQGKHYLRLGAWNQTWAPCE